MMTALVSDRIIAGGPGDFMQVRHLVLRGSQRAIGRALGTIAREQLGTEKNRAWSDPQATARQARWLAEYWPAHYQRSLGAAEAFGADPLDPREDFSLLYYDWAVPGCSNAFWPAATTACGHNLLSRNYDFSTASIFELMGWPAPPQARPATSRPFLIETQPDAGFQTMTMGCYEMLGGVLDGINDAGLGIALMSTTERLRGAAGSAALGRNSVGLPEIQLQRFVLENAASAAEARRLLTTHPQYALTVPCHYLVADAQGDSFLWSAQIAERPVCIDGAPNRPHCATNHIPGHAVDQAIRAESVARLASLEAAVAEARGHDGRAERSAIIAANAAVAATHPPGVGQYRGLKPARTLWHALYDLDARSLSIDFYLGEGQGGEIRRSPRLDFQLVPAAIARPSREPVAARASHSGF